MGTVFLSFLEDTVSSQPPGPLSLAIFLSLLSQLSQALCVGLCCVCTSWDCVPQDHLFLAFLLVVSLCCLKKLLW